MVPPLWLGEARELDGMKQRQPGRLGTSRYPAQEDGRVSVVVPRLKLYVGALVVRFGEVRVKGQAVRVSLSDMLPMRVAMEVEEGVQPHRGWHREKHPGCDPPPHRGILRNAGRKGKGQIGALYVLAKYRFSARSTSCLVISGARCS